MKKSQRARFSFSFYRWSCNSIRYPDKFPDRSTLSKERSRRWNRPGRSRTNGDDLIKFIVNAYRARSRNARTISSGTRLIKIHLSLKSRSVSGFCKRREHAVTTDFPLTLLPDLRLPFSLSVRFFPFYYPEATIKHELIIALPRYSDLSLVSSRRYIMQHLLTLRCIMECRELRPFIHCYRRRRRHSRNSFLRPANLSQMRTNDSSLILKTSRFPIESLNAHLKYRLFPSIQSSLQSFLIFFL